MPDSTPQPASGAPGDTLDESSARGSASANAHLQFGTRRRKSRVCLMAPLRTHCVWTVDQVSLTARVQACEMCYQKKTKCEVEGSSPICLQCVRRGTKCVFGTRIEKRDGLKRYATKSRTISDRTVRSRGPHSAQYVRSLKDRLEKLESLLKTAGILDEDALDQEELSDDDDELADEDWKMEDVQHEEPPDLSPTNSSASHASPKPNEHNQPSSSRGDLEHARLFKIDDRDESRYFGMLRLWHSIA